MEAFATLVARLTGLLPQIAKPLALLWVGWGCLKGLLSGSTDRALQQLLVRGLVAGILLAMLSNLPSTFEVFASVGNALLQTVLQAFAGAF